jgi:hypothetical protein
VFVCLCVHKRVDGWRRRSSKALRIGTGTACTRVRVYPRTAALLADVARRPHQTVLEGTWLLKEGSSGTFDAVSCQHTAVDAADSCVLVWGGPWLFDASSIRSEGGLAVDCTKASAALLLRCKLGGISSTRRAAAGVSVGSHARFPAGVGVDAMRGALPSLSDQADVAMATLHVHTVAPRVFAAHDLQVFAGQV